MSGSPSSLHAVVLDSVTPPGASFFTAPRLHLMRALRALDRLCAGDAACVRRWGSLEATLVEVAEQLRRSPLALPVAVATAVGGSIHLGPPPSSRPCTSCSTTAAWIRSCPC